MQNENKECVVKIKQTIVCGFCAAIIVLAFGACDTPADPPPAHTHQWGEWIETTAPTCTKEGVETRYCTLDSSHKETQPIPIDEDAHRWGTWRVTTPATETQDGEETRTCTLCGHQETASIPAIGRPPAITYTVTQTGGVDGASNTTGIIFIFSESVDSLNLTIANITVGGAAAKGSATFTGSGANWTLAPITVNEAGLATVTIAKDRIETTTRNLTVYKQGQPVSGILTITWHLDGGAEGRGEYPAQITKGTVLAKPSPDPTKTDKALDGWYTDTGLTQAYTFTSPVTTNLNLYAKWRNRTLADKLAWVLDEDNVQDGQTYTLTVDADEVIRPHTLTYANRSDITIQLTGGGGEKIVSFRWDRTSLFTIESGVTLVLGNNVTLEGNNYTDSRLVWVNAGGTLKMEAGAKITNSERTSRGGGVYVDGGTFTMDGGEISGNTGSFRGGGVYVSDGTFTMNGGEISGNTVSSSYEGEGGGGVYVADGIFTMNDGEISGNTVSGSGFYVSSCSKGGGVYVADGTFIMYDGEISGNTASFSGFTSSTRPRSSGGGVSSDGTFTMHGGKISDNTAVTSYTSIVIFSAGGGVSGSLTMYGGKISGNTADNGGGVDGPLTMHGGEISGNTAGGETGGGVRGSPLTMYGGKISGNTGYGVFGVAGGSFTMYDGEISGNSSGVYLTSYSQGITVYRGTFTMNGGKISGNTGYGVQVGQNSIFRIVTGTVYGRNETDTNLSNWSALYVSDSSGGITNGIAECGTFDGTTWVVVSRWWSGTYDDTIRVVNGVLQEE